MPHQTTGYFYFEFVYDFPFVNRDGSTGTIKDGLHTAYYRRGNQSHVEQNKFFRNEAFPAARQDIERFLATHDNNKLGRTYAPFSGRNIRQMKFVWTKKVPPHRSGQRKGMPYGRDLRAKRVDSY
ncbi:hypothetical protein MN608_09054 [Microdochium nivale]|nr:hypothetical protein MN608_09054 [Microdochium nivale]